MKKVIGLLALVLATGSASYASAAGVGDSYAALTGSPLPTFSAQGQLCVGAGGDSDPDHWVLGSGAARATFWIAPNVSTQVDGNFESWNWDNYGTWTRASVVGHINFRNPHFLLGIYGGLMDIGFEDRLQPIGVEGQIYFSHLTLEGRASFVTESGDSDTAKDFRGAARIFLNPDFMIEANAGFQNFSWGWNAYEFGGVIEHKLPNAPVSVMASLDSLHMTQGNWSALVGKVGVKFLFNQQTLRSADQTGSSLGDWLEPFDLEMLHTLP